jgi:flagellar basal-body rod modification protein FlgD
MMQVAAATAGSGAALPTQSFDGTDDFMTLLVAQLKAQDPMDPMNPSEFMSQLAQLQSVAELQNISGLLADASLTDAAALIGRTVQWADPGTGELLSAPVESVDISGSECRLIAGGTELSMDDVLTVSS